MTPFSLKRGDTTVLPVSSGAYDLTTAEGLIFTLKASVGLTDAQATLQKELAYGVTVVSSNLAHVELVHADTKPLDPSVTYQWDLQAQRGGVITTVNQGTLRASGDVTREVGVSIPIIQVEPAAPASLGAEVVARISADASLDSAIGLLASVDLAADISLAAAVAAEQSRALAAEAGLGAEIDAISSDLSALSLDAAANAQSLAALIDAEAGLRSAADASLDAAYESLATAISAEVSRAGVAESSIAGALSARVSERVSADTSLASAISAEASTRSAADVSLASAITAANSTRSAADTSLASAITAEASTARAAEATKATLNQPVTFTTLTTTVAATFAGTANLNGGAIIGTDTAGAILDINGPAGVNRAIRFRTASKNRWAVLADGSSETGANAGSILKVVRYEDAGAYLADWLTVSRANGAWATNGDWTQTGNASISGALTVDTITNYASPVTVTALLALSAAASAKRRIAYVSGCYTLDGTLGDALAFWRGTSSAGSWVLAAAPDVPVTTSAESFATAVLISGYIPASTPQGSAWGSGAYKLALDRFVPCAVTNDAAGLASVASGASIVTVLSGQIERAVLITLATTANSSFMSGASDLRFPIWKAVNTAANCVARFRHAISAVGFAAESSALAFGMIQVGQNFGATTRTIAAIVDPANLYGFGVSNSNIHLIVHNGTSFTLQDTGVAETVSATLADITFVRLGSSTVRAYRNGVQLGNDITTTIPDLAFAMHAFFCGKRGASAGSLAPVFRQSEMSSVQIAP